MSPLMSDLLTPVGRFPRVSGDEPAGLIAASPCKVFSPRERG